MKPELSGSSLTAHLLPAVWHPAPFPRGAVIHAACELGSAPRGSGGPREGSAAAGRASEESVLLLLRQGKVSRRLTAAFRPRTARTEWVITRDVTAEMSLSPLKRGTKCRGKSRGFDLLAACLLQAVCLRFIWKSCSQITPGKLFPLVFSWACAAARLQSVAPGWL